jgi:hypothetical protein
MSLIAKLMQGLAGTGSRRAVDRIPELTAQAAYWEAVAFKAQAKLDHADRLMTRVCAEKSAALVENARLTAEVELLAEANELIVLENDELAARLIEARSDLANARMVRPLTPADHGPAILLHPYDPDATAETNVTTLWNGLGLRPNATASAA